MYLLLNMLSLITVIIAWPDGAPCIHAVFESMNPLEAVEHQGGLQLTIPPYHIAVRQKCYWINQPIECMLY
uniref:Secreted protein n=1 Tax=Loa loa TaxID=7209 RepID=A0A1I7VKR1_LOALO